MLTEEFEDQAFETDLVLEHMKKLGLPLTKQAYLAFNYPDGVPTESLGELDVPRWLRDADETLH